MNRRVRAAALALCLSMAGGWAASAQPPDTVAVDTLSRDTTDYSALFLRTREEGRQRVLTLPRLNRPDLLPATSRRVFDRDTIEWHGAATVGDLLTKVPGVYLWRGGWIGRPEMPSYQGRGATSVEYLLDGIPYLALGPDSISVDPSLFPLSFLDRVEVERLPGQLRVHLYTRRHDRLPPRTRVSVASGDFDIARYQGLLERRLGNGFGYVLAGEHLAVPLGTGQQGSFRSTQGWIQLSYVPGPRFAANLQVFRAGPDREDVFAGPGTGDTLSAGLDGRRTDVQASVTYGGSRGGLGGRVSLAAAYSSWQEDSTALSLPLPANQHQHLRLVDQSVSQLAALASWRSPAVALDGGLWYRSRWTPVEARARVGASPSRTLSGAVEAVYRRHLGGRTSSWMLARAGVTLPLQVQASAIARFGSEITMPSDPADRGGDLRDWAATLAWERPRAGFEVGYWHTAGSSPQGFPLYRRLPGLAPAQPARWVTFSGRVAPRQWLVLDGWYSDAVGGAGPEGQPPTHSVLNASIQSRFLPTFRSGIFALKVQGTMESWGTGILGRDPAGEPVVLRGATFFRGLIQFQIGTFTAYYDRINLTTSRLGYVPGLPLPVYASTFGVRWEFSN